ncbi:MAG: signal peptidase II [Oligoflexia bacterium]|nr:signal peptidase II [Oligoflexia bacterium]
MKIRTIIVFLATALSITLLDQISKQAILDSVSLGQVIEVIPDFFNLTLAMNPGVAFGLFAGLSDGLRIAALIGTTSLALAVVLYLLFVDYRRDPIGRAALALVLGGAFGNLVDRFRFGRVVDFLDLYLSDYHWPAFNLADSAICIGVVLLVIKGVTASKPQQMP